MFKLKYLRHPMQTAAAVQRLVRDRLEMRWLAFKGKRHFRNDRRYDLQCVSDGFAAQRARESDDSLLLDRISSAYRIAMEQERYASPNYGATEWWNVVRRTALGPVRQALSDGDVRALGWMYRRFFRDPCSAGLVSTPYGMSRDYFGARIPDALRHYYLSDTLHRLDYWGELVGDGHKLSDLAGPSVGEPFGTVIDGVLVRRGADYQHYCAHKVGTMMDGNQGVVLELGGGFGGTAYYLLRDQPGLKYLNVDVPESLALSSYFLIKSFPELKFLLYGEEELTQEAIERANVVLIPLWEIERIPAAMADVTFSSHAISDLTPAAMDEYLRQIGRATCGRFLYWGNASSLSVLSNSIDEYPGLFHLTDMQFLRWHRHRTKAGAEIECSFRVLTDGVADREGRSARSLAHLPE